MNDKINKKHRTGIVYSTKNDFEYEYDENAKSQEEETLKPENQKLKIYTDTKHRKGKIVTIVEGFVGTEDDCKELAKMLKTKCGVGGSVKSNEIIIQGNFKDIIKDILIQKKYKIVN